VIPGRKLPTGREIACHEAYHAAALSLAGMVPICARTDFPVEPAGGIAAVGRVFFAGLLRV